MCCGQAFWKRIVAFGLTFGLGVFVAGLLISRQALQTVKPIVVPATAENKNCVPMDEKLKFERLAVDEKNVPAVVKQDSKLKTKKPEDKQKSLTAEPDKQNKSVEPQYYDPSKDSAEFKELLHKEKCFETQTQ